MAPTTTATTTTTDRSARAVAAARSPRLRTTRALRPLTSVRTRILTWFVGLLAATTLGSLLVAREVLSARLDDRIDADLVQEASELRRLAGGVDPATGRPFAGDAARIFEVFLQRNIPSRGEALLTFVDGRPYLRSRHVVPYRLDRDPALVERWGRLRHSARGSVSTPAGRVEFLAVPLRSGDRVLGVFVVAAFRDVLGRSYDDAVAVTGGVGLAVLLVGSLLGWRLSESVLRPVRTVTTTARSISETDLGGRIDIRASDEIAELAATFNEMLDRLEGAFSTQQRFLDDAGHELKTPITIVRGHLELLEQDDAEARRETVALVLDELDRMSRIVNDLLLLAKAEQPDFLHLETVDIGELTDELHSKASALARRRWSVEARGRGIVVADRQRLTQAVVQLAQNAVQHTTESGEIALGSAIVDGDAHIWVRDDGSGIPAAEHQSIFERFKRGSAESRTSGAGLGLSIVSAIADAHRGRVELRSRPGAGAVFTLVLPVDPPAGARG